jgi:hypothetical protein
VLVGSSCQVVAAYHQTGCATPTLNPAFCPLQFKLVSTDVFDQFKVNGVMHSAVDVEYNAMHQGEQRGGTEKQAAGHVSASARLQLLP